MTTDVGHGLAEATERVKMADAVVADLDRQIARIDAPPAAKTVKVTVRGRTTETVVPLAGGNDKVARPALEARRTSAAGELADARVSMAGHVAEHDRVESEINTIRAVAGVVGLGNDPVLAVNLLAGLLAVLWDPFAVFLLVASTRRAEKPVRAVVRRRRPAARKPAAKKFKDNNKNDNVVAIKAA
jgi:hypothetical protein